MSKRKGEFLITAKNKKWAFILTAITILASLGSWWFTHHEIYGMEKIASEMGQNIPAFMIYLFSTHLRVFPIFVLSLIPALIIKDFPLTSNAAIWTNSLTLLMLVLYCLSLKLYTNHWHNYIEAMSRS